MCTWCMYGCTHSVCMGVHIVYVSAHGVCMCVLAV